MLDYTYLAKLSLKEIIDYVVDKLHMPLREDLLNIRKAGMNLYKECQEDSKILEKLALVIELFNQFEKELINHLNREENKIYLKIFNDGEINKKDLEQFLNVEKIEHSELLSYLLNSVNILDGLCLNNNESYKNMMNIVDRLVKNAKETIFIEDNLINPKIKEMLEK